MHLFGTSLQQDLPLRHGHTSCRVCLQSDRRMADVDGLVTVRRCQDTTEPVKCIL
jgi:hypothetical protein